MTRDRHVLKAALESGKKPSNKQLEKLATQVSSRASSKAVSAANSRVASRAASEDGDSDTNDLDRSFGSLRFDDPDAELLIDPSTQGFRDLLEEIVIRKGSTTAGRELALTRYVANLRHRVETDEIEKKSPELMMSFLKSIKNEASEKEVCLALKAVQITFITAPPAVEDDLRWAVRRCMDEEQSSAIRAESINTLGAIAAFGDFDDEEMERIMDEMVTILNTEVFTDKNDLPFRAACEQWAFLATYLEDLEDKTEMPVEAFLRQLKGSSNIEVQLAAATAIALLYEKSHTERESNDTPLTKEQLENNYEVDNQYVKRFTVIENYETVKELSNAVAQLAGKSTVASRGKMSRDHKKIFQDVLQTMEHPARGPNFRDTIDYETGMVRGYGAKKEVDGSVMYVDRWWKLIRYEAIKKIVKGGFAQHYEANEQIFRTLPVLLAKS